MLTDGHAHLDSTSMLEFVASLSGFQNGEPDQPRLRIISNSTDLVSSKKNLEIASKFPEIVVPFVGIHPQTLRDHEEIDGLTRGELIKSIESLASKARGVGEIGLEPKYGAEKLQVDLFEAQIEICERDPSLPLTVHSRNTIEKISDILTTYNLRNKILFHWFGGSERELASVQARGYFVSFGPALIFSKRLQRLFRFADVKLVLAETDSPLALSSISTTSTLSPFAVASVIFKMSQLRGISFSDMVEQIERCVEVFISARAQNSLRLRRE